MHVHYTGKTTNLTYITSW